MTFTHVNHITNIKNTYLSHMLINTMFKFKTALMLGSLVAMLTLCSIPAKAQTRDTVIVSGLTDSLTSVVDKLADDTAAQHAVVKAIAVIQNTPKDNSPASWIGYGLTVLFAALLVWKHIRANFYKQAANAEITEHNFTKQKLQVLGSGLALANEMLQTKVDDTKATEEVEHFTPEEIRTIKVNAGFANDVSDAVFGKWVKGNYETNFNNLKAGTDPNVTKASIAKWYNLYKALTVPAGAKVKRVLTNPTNMPKS